MLSVQLGNDLVPVVEGIDPEAGGLALDAPLSVLVAAAVVGYKAWHFGGEKMITLDIGAIAQAGDPDGRKNLAVGDATVAHGGLLRLVVGS
jgi:hypothetical protein